MKVMDNDNLALKIDFLSALLVNSLNSSEALKTFNCLYKAMFKYKTKMQGIKAVTKNSQHKAKLK